MRLHNHVYEGTAACRRCVCFSPATNTCRRRSPVHGADPYPTVEQDGWCGEYLPAGQAILDRRQALAEDRNRLEDRADSKANDFTVGTVQA